RRPGEATPGAGGGGRQGPPRRGGGGGAPGGGGSDGRATGARRATGEALLAPPRKRRSQGGRITGDPAKSAEGERVAEGPAGAARRGNARGAKGPCWSRILHRHGRQGGGEEGAPRSARPR